MTKEWVHWICALRVICRKISTVRKIMPGVIFSLDEVFKLLKKRNRELGAWARPDIQRYTQKFADGGSSYFMAVFNRSLTNLSLLYYWITANALPIHDRIYRDAVFKYKQISPTNVSCKAVEQIVCSIIMNHLKANGFFQSLLAWISMRSLVY